MVRAGGAGLPACRFAGLSSPVMERATGKSPAPAERWSELERWLPAGRAGALGTRRQDASAPVDERRRSWTVVVVI